MKLNDGTADEVDEPKGPVELPKAEVVPKAKLDPKVGVELASDFLIGGSDFVFVSSVELLLESFAMSVFKAEAAMDPKVGVDVLDPNAEAPVPKPKAEPEEEPKADPEDEDGNAEDAPEVNEDPPKVEDEPKVDDDPKVGLSDEPPRLKEKAVVFAGASALVSSAGA